VESANRLLAVAWPLLREAVAQQVEQQVQPQLQALARQYGLGCVASLVLARFDLGGAPPQLSGLKAYRAREDEVIVEVVGNWASGLDVQLAAGLQLPGLQQLRRAAVQLAAQLAARLRGDAGQQDGGARADADADAGSGGSPTTITFTLDMRAAAPASQQPAADDGSATAADAADAQQQGPAAADAAGSLQLPLRLANLQLRAHVRLVVRPLLQIFPYAGSLSATLLAPPQLDFDLQIGGSGVDLLALPLARSLAQRALRVRAGRRAGCAGLATHSPAHAARLHRPWPPVPREPTTSHQHITAGRRSWRRGWRSTRGSCGWSCCPAAAWRPGRRACCTCGCCACTTCTAAATSAAPRRTWCCRWGGAAQPPPQR
jgi:Ca2+-dependent lipid-binding protein